MSDVIRSQLHPSDFDPLFLAMTRPTMILGVTYSFFILNFFVSYETFIITQTFLKPIMIFAAVHYIGYVCCRHDPRIFDIFFIKVQKCRFVSNYFYWRCNSYSP